MQIVQLDDVPLRIEIQFLQFKNIETTVSLGANDNRVSLLLGTGANSLKVNRGERGQYEYSHFCHPVRERSG